VNEKILIIVGMALVTYFPRGIPFLLKFRGGGRFIKYIPVSIFAALIFPELANFDAKTVAGGIAFITAYFSRNMFLTMIVGILALYILSNF